MSRDLSSVAEGPQAGPGLRHTHLETQAGRSLLQLSPEEGGGRTEQVAQPASTCHLGLGPGAGTKRVTTATFLDATELLGLALCPSS